MLVLARPDVEERLAESVVLRGARRGGWPLHANQAAQALDAALLQEGDVTNTCSLAKNSSSVRIT